MRESQQTPAPVLLARERHVQMKTSEGLVGILPFLALGTAKHALLIQPRSSNLGSLENLGKRSLCRCKPELNVYQIRGVKIRFSYLQHEIWD